MDFSILKVILGGKTQIPTQSDALVWLDGSIIGNNFIDKISGRLFPISNKDFDTDWEYGFPYKSNATITAPVGDTELISYDLNNFWYTAGTPNQISVIALFQDIDYEHRMFCKHQGQSLGVNGEELVQPRVTDIILYKTVKTGADLSTCLDFFQVPTEVTTNVHWVAPASLGGSNSNAGTKVAPYLTLAYAEANATLTGTTYVKTGTYKAATYFYPVKTQNYIGTGNCILQSVSTTYVIQGQTPAGYNLSNFTIDSETNTDYGLLSYNACTYNKLRFINQKNSNLCVQLQSQDGTVFNNCIFIGGTASFGQNKSVTINTCYYNVYTTCTVASKTLTYTNNKFIMSLSAAYDGLIKIIGDSSISVKGGSLSMNSGRACIYGSFTQSAAATVSFTYVNVLMTVTIASLINVGTGGFKTGTFSNNTILNNTAAGSVIENQGGTNWTVNNNWIKTTAGASGIVLTKNVTTSTTVTISNNTIISLVDNPYAIRVGNETTGSPNNSISSITISNNKILSPRYYGASSTQQHGIFIGFMGGGSVTMTRNYITGSALGIVLKGSNTDMGNCFITYNVVTNCSGYGCYFKATKNNNLFNNTFVNNHYEIFFSINSGSDGAINNKIQNNILYNNTTGGYLYYFSDSTSFAQDEIDNNCLYFVGAKLAYSSTADISLSTWINTHGRDENSVNSDPLLTNFIPANNSPVIGVGVNEGSHNTGLDITTNWGTDTVLPVIITKVQPASWIIGAYIL